MLDLLGFLQDLVSLGRIPLRDIPARGESGGWVLGALILVGAIVLATVQALSARGP